jgi:hypothetical protein
MENKIDNVIRPDNNVYAHIKGKEVKYAAKKTLYLEIKNTN